jgi:hypothetical protein
MKPAGYQSAADSAHSWTDHRAAENERRVVMDALKFFSFWYLGKSIFLHSF